MLVIGLTGGIACGKTTVSRRLEKRHKLPIIDADKVAREVVEPGQDAYNKIVDYFKTKIPDLLNEDGTLNRAALGKWVFCHPEDLKALNGITHPAIRYEIFKKVGKCYLKGYKMCILDVPLLFEAHLDTFCGVTVSVICGEETQLRRLLERNPEMSLDEARNRIKSQMPMNERIRRSDYVINNDGDLESLYGQIQGVISTVTPTLFRTALEYFPPFGAISATAIILTKYVRYKVIQSQIDKKNI